MNASDAEQSVEQVI